MVVVVVVVVVVEVVVVVSKRYVVVVVHHGAVCSVARSLTCKLLRQLDRLAPSPPACHE